MKSCKHRKITIRVICDECDTWEDLHIEPRPMKEDNKKCVK